MKIDKSTNKIVLSLNEFDLLVDIAEVFVNHLEDCPYVKFELSVRLENARNILKQVEDDLGKNWFAEAKLREWRMKKNEKNKSSEI